MPHTSSVSLPWRLRKNRYCLVGSTCVGCSLVFFPPRVLCPKCGKNNTTKDVFLKDVGKIVSFTTINSAPRGFEQQTPYVVGVIKLADGVTITTQVVGPQEAVVVGKRVSGVFRKIHEDGEAGLITYGLKFNVLG